MTNSGIFCKNTARQKARNTGDFVIWNLRNIAKNILEKSEKIPNKSDTDTSFFISYLPRLIQVFSAKITPGQKPEIWVIL